MIKRDLFSTLVGLVVLCSAAPSHVHGQAKPPKQQGTTAMPDAKSKQGSLTITAAVVMTDMTVRRLPEFALELLNETDSTQRVALRTALDGTASTTLPVGRYVLRSRLPVVLNDSSYQWSVAVDVSPSGSRIELTNVNATVVGAQRTAARQIAPEREIYERVRGGVFRVEAGLGHGSGFFAQIPGIDVGLVVTDDHVVANDKEATVYLDSVTRVPAVVIARDREADLALLRIPASFAKDRPLLRLATPKGGEPLVVSGERILAIGFPLHQQMTLTTGIVSSVRDGAIISDVNINHGNSGGPMLNLAGEVVGVNAFGDFTSEGGPGISGAIAITRLDRVITQAQTAFSTAPLPEERTLPAMPLATYPIAALKETADTVDPKSYRKLLERGADHFTLNITTPVLYRVEQRLFENEVGSDRKARESQAGISKDQGYSETRQARDWEQYVGESNTPVVTIAISPHIGETSGSAFRRGLLGPLAQASFVFDGDVRGAHFYRNGVEIQPIAGGHGPIVQNVENMLVKLKDVADYGYYIMPPELFKPDSTGAPARVRVAIEDLKRPTETSGTEIEGELSARVWNDFRAYYKAVDPNKPFIAADPALPSPRVNMACDAGRCHVIE
jgi:S1-C subfamily serine protease